MAVTRSSISLKSFSQRLGVGKTRPKVTTSMFDGPGSTSGPNVTAEAAQLEDIKSSLQKLLILEKQHYDELGNRILKFSKQEERDRLRKKEEDQESKKSGKKENSKKNPFIKGVSKGLDGLVSFFGNLFKWFIGYKIVEWVSKPENLKKVQNFSKLFLGIIKFVSNVAGFGVDKLLDGINKLVNGEGVTRVFGILEAVVGFFTLKWLANPLKIVSDIKGIANIFTKTIPNTINSVINFFSNIIPTAATEAVDNAVKEGFKGSEAWAKNFPKEAAAHAAKQGSKGAAEAVAKAGGKAATEVAAKEVAKGGAKIGGKTLLKKLPILGAIAGGVFAVDRASKGDWMGAGLELASGGASLIPGWGTVASLGIDAALVARDIQKESQVPKLAKGGIVTKPTKAIVGEAGPEAIIPLDKLSSFAGKGFASDVNKEIPNFMKLLTFPFKIIGAAIIGLMSTTLATIPGIGPFVLPLLSNIASTFGVPKIILGTIGNFKAAAGGAIQAGANELSKLFGNRNPIVKSAATTKFTPSGDKTVRGLLANILSLLISKNSPTSPTGNNSTPSTGSPTPDTPSSNPAGDSPKIGGSNKPLPQNATLAKAGNQTVQNMAGTESDLLAKGYRYVPNTGNRFWQDSEGRLYEATRVRNNTSLATMMGVGQESYKLKAVTQDQIDNGFTSVGNVNANNATRTLERDKSIFRIINEGGMLKKEIINTIRQIQNDKGQWIDKKLGGGKVYGVGSGDKIHALLEPEEYVLNKNAVRGMGGPGALDKINFGMFPRFQRGGHVVTSIPFVNRSIPGVSSGMHMGADIGANYEPLKAYVDGQVLETSPPADAAGYGPKWIVWKGSDGRGHMFAHMSQIYVKKGDTLRKGQKIGISGRAGTGPHLHWEVATNPADVGQDKSSKRSRLNPIALFGSEAPFGGDIRPGEGSTDIAGSSQSGAEPGNAFDPAEIARLLGSLYKGLTGKGSSTPPSGAQPAAPNDKVTSPGHTNRGSSASPTPTPSRSTSSQSLSSAQSKNNTLSSQIAQAKPAENIIDLGNKNNVIYETSTQPIASTLGGTIKNNPLVLYPIAV